MWRFKLNQHKSKIVLAFLFVILVIVLRYMGLGEHISLEKIKQNREYLIHFVSQNYTLSVCIYLLVFITASFLSIPITVMLNIAAGLFFGALPGALYANIGTTIGATCSFLLFRYLLGDFVKEKYSAKLKELNAHIEQYGYSYLLSLQLFPATPTFLINTLAGLTSVSLWTFIWTTSVGILPGSLVYTFAGHQLSKLESAKDVLSLPIILVLILLGLVSLLPIVLARFFNKK